MNDRESLYRVLFIRFIIATAILIVNTALFGLGRVPVYFLVAATYVLTIGYSVMLLAGLRGAGFRYMQICSDLIVTTLLVQYTGSVDSVLSVLYPLASVAAALLISPRAALVTAFLGSALHAAMISMDYLGQLAWMGTPPISAARDATYVFSLLYLRITVFSVIGFMAAYLMEQSARNNSMVVSLKESLRREDRLRSIGRLAASTAHEIRNPLASISGCVEALRATIPHDEQSERLFSLILKETARLNNIIGGLLEFGRPRKLKLQTVAPAELVDEVITLIRGGKELPPGIVVDNETMQTRYRVRCDSEQMKQVIFNLLNNALEALPGHGRVRVQEFLRLPEKRYELLVSDSGAGMDEERLASLFQPFSSGKEHGIGLGLAIAFSIVQEHGGSIEVNSKPGKGAQFRIVLPLSDGYQNENVRGER